VRKTCHINTKASPLSLDLSTCTLSPHLVGHGPPIRRHVVVRHVQVGMYLLNCSGTIVH
jgi:hypothetical protein